MLLRSRALLVPLLLAACAGPPAASPGPATPVSVSAVPTAGHAPFPASASAGAASATPPDVVTANSGREPGNVGTAKAAAYAYARSEAVQADRAQVTTAALDWLRAQAPKVAHPALVLDVDETSLDNLPAMLANDDGYFVDGPCDRLPHGPCGFRAWEERGDATAIAPTLQLVQAAQRMGVAVFFVTGRNEDLRAATERNLRRAGYAGWTGLVLEPRDSHWRRASDFKAPARAQIEARGYTIVANIGDQYSDLAGGHALRGFKLPNPLYFLP